MCVVNNMYTKMLSRSSYYRLRKVKMTIGKPAVKRNVRYDCKMVRTRRELYVLFIFFLLSYIGTKILNCKFSCTGCGLNTDSVIQTHVQTIPPGHM